MTFNYFITPPCFAGDYCALCYRYGFHTAMVSKHATMAEAKQAMKERKQLDGGN